MRKDVGELKAQAFLRSALAAALLASVGLVAPSQARAATYTADTYESGAGDDTWGTARDVTSYLTYSAWYGDPLRVEEHSFDRTDEPTIGACDEDWIKFTVTQANIDAGDSFIFEAVARDPLVDPVIEVYGPNTASPTAPIDLVESTETSGVTELDPDSYVANDDGPWFERRSASLSFLPEVGKPGVYYARIRPYYQYVGSPGAGFRGGIGRYYLRLKTGQISRVSGADRFATSVAISKERFPAEGPAAIPTYGRSAVLANGSVFADALAGSTLAGAVGGPVLLCSTTSLPSNVKAELSRLDIDTVFLLGGTAAVSTGVERTLKSAGFAVVRIAGARRQETARLVAKKAATIVHTAPVAFVVNADRFPDALAASPLATFNDAPVLLTSATSLDSPTVTALNDPALGITDVVIVGGTAVVSSSVQSKIAALLGGSGHVRRIAGSSRYSTARDFAVWATGIKDTTGDRSKIGTTSNPDALGVLEYARVGIASGEDFPDALSGGVFCGLGRAPILLTASKTVSPYVLDIFGVLPLGGDYWYAADLAIVRSYIFGGTRAVSDGDFVQLDVFTGP